MSKYAALAHLGVPRTGNGIPYRVSRIGATARLVSDQQVPAATFTAQGQATAQAMNEAAASERRKYVDAGLVSPNAAEANALARVAALAYGGGFFLAGGALAALWKAHRVLGFFLGGIFIGPVIGATATAIWMSQQKRPT